MPIGWPARMEKRLSDPSKLPLTNHSRKNKKRSGRRSNLDTITDAWPNGPQNDQDGSLVSDMEYPLRMMWQSTGVPQNVSGNGQRLYTAMSDPSVCSCSQLPVAYAMQPMSLPTMYKLYQPTLVPNDRTVHRHRHHCNAHFANVPPNANNNIINGYENRQKNERLGPAIHIAHQNGDYASLPPTANKDHSINGDEINSEHRRYSDPGLGPAENSPHSDSDNSDIESGSSITTISCNNKLVLSFIEQMTELKKQNNLLFKELTETKSNLENIKAKLAQCKHSTPTDYQPGMLSEFISKIREANKNCEENLIAKVKSMLEESCTQQVKELEVCKNQLTKLVKEKNEDDQRIAKLEEEVTALKLNTTNEGHEEKKAAITAFEKEMLAVRRELQKTRRSRTLAEGHAAKMEKLMEILRKKVNDATAAETINRIRDVLASGAYTIPEGPIKKSTNQILSSSSSSSEDEESEAEADDGDKHDNGDDDDNDVNDKKSDAFRIDKNSSIASDSKTPPVIENSVSLSGPVTDL